MATRNPTTWNQYVNENNLRVREIIRTTTPSQVVDDQHFVLDASQMVWSDCSFPFDTTSAVMIEIGRFYTPGKNMSGDTTNTLCDHDIRVYAWAGAGVTEFQIEVTWPGGFQVDTINSSLTSKIWRSLSSPSVAADGSEQEFIFEMRVSGGAGTIYFAGISIIGQET